MFKEEVELIDVFRSTISKNESPLNIQRTEIEFGHLSGRTDVIGLSHEGEIIAVEAKLHNWKIALQQAYKNTCYAHYSYVLLPPSKLNPAIKNENEFQRRKVGLFTLINGEIIILIEAIKTEPFIGRVTAEAYKLLRK